MVALRLVSRDRLAKFACLAGLVASGWECKLFAESLTYADVAYRATQSPESFSSLWAKGLSQTVRIAVFGDSQETSPGGAGRVFVPRLNYEMWKNYGNMPETPVTGMGSFGGGSPPAQWLVRGAGSPNPGASPSSLDSSFSLPGVTSAAHSTKNKAANINGQYYGQLTMIQPDARDVDATASLPAGTQFFSMEGIVKAEVFAATAPGSGEVQFITRPTASSVPSFFASSTTTGQITLGLDAPVGQVLSGTSTPLDTSDAPYLSVEFTGNSDDRLTELMAIRFRNESRPEGVVISNFAAGGYATRDIASRHANAGPLFASLGFDAAVLHFGANDVVLGVTAEQFATDQMNLIRLIRGWTGRPDFPIILVAEVDRLGLASNAAFEYDRYAVVQEYIASSETNILFINSRRAMSEAGWSRNSTTIGKYLWDDVHYNADGAALLAEWEVSTMLGTFVPEPTMRIVLAFLFLAVLKSTGRSRIRLAILHAAR